MNLPAALAAFKQAVSDAYVETDIDVLEQYEAGTYKHEGKVLAIVKPANTAEVQRCMAIANEFHIPMYPVSRGCNWGYGSKAPVKNACVIIDLSRMDKITHYSEAFGYVTIEPGVTLGGLNRFLRSQKSNLVLSTTGGSVDSSLIGNTMERGIGTGLYAERLGYVCGFEVVLPDGRVIKTGFERYGEDSLTAKTFKWGVGPYLDGIFTQSNLGIVTSLTMWLTTVPEYFHFIHYEVDSADKYYSLIDHLHEMAVSGLVRPTLTMYNNFRVLSTVRQFPATHSAEWAHLPSNERTQKILQYANEGMNVKLWTGEICIRGVNKEHAAVQSNAVKDKIASYTDSLSVYEVGKEEMLQRLNGNGSADSDSLQDALKNYLIGKYLGIPDNVPVSQSYWRKDFQVPVNMNPDKDKCGMIWMCPTVPFDGANVKKAIDMIEAIIIKYGFEPAISMQCTSERSVHLIASIAWDREVPGEDEKAEQCYDELHIALHSQGYYFYRETTHAMASKIVDQDNTLDDFLKSLKRAVDPNNILAPGRYIKG